MKYLFLCILFIINSLSFYGQTDNVYTEKVFRVNFINPGLEYEMPFHGNGVLSGGFGIGYEGNFEGLEESGHSGFQYEISPFIDVGYKQIYNLEKRNQKGKNTACNSGNYWGLRSLSHFKAIKSNFTRKDDVNFLVGPVWGIQRKFGSFHFLFDIGPVYYFDTKGNSGFWPFNIQLNLGLDLKKKK